MLENYSRYRILQEFFGSPKRGFHIRELSRELKLAQVSIINHLKALVREGLVLKENKGLYPTYMANRENQEFKILKKQNTILNIHKSGLIEHIEDKIKPDCIVLFGSSSRGEDAETSDIDLFVQSKEKNPELKDYEKVLKRKINILFDLTLEKLGKELLNNIINAEVLYGYLKVS